MTVHQIRPAVPDDIEDCLAIEESLREDRPRAAAEGFLLSGGGDGREQYEQYVSYGAFYVATIEDAVTGFVFALPPGSARMERLRSSRGRFRLFREEDIFDQLELAWLAKVGIAPSFMRSGMASALYHELFHRHPSWRFITTTVREPLRNIPSERLHQKFGFITIGELGLGDRGALKNIVCDVQYRVPEAGRIGVS